MGVRKGEKRFRKKVGDVRKSRVGPTADELDKEVSEDEEFAGMQEQGDDSSVEVEQERDQEPEEGGKAEKDGKVFQAAVERVLKDKEGKGFLGSYSLEEQKKEEKVKRKLEKKKLKKKRAFEVEGGQGYISESSESEASEDEATKKQKARDKKVLKKHILSQAHNKVVPSLEQPDYEKRLRRVATKGVVRLFNAVAVAQKEPEEEASSGPQKIPELGEQLPKSKKNTGPSTADVTRSKFLDMLKKGSDSKTLQDGMILVVCVLGLVCGGVKEDVQRAIESFSAEHHGHAVVVSFKNSTLEWSVASGYRNFRATEDNRLEARVDDGFLFGSVTKLYTAVAVMKLVHSKQLDLSEPAFPYVDFYLASNGTSMAMLYGDEANNITIEHLLSMRAGLTEFDTTELRDWQLKNPTVDFTPIDIANYLPDKKLRCAPGTCGAYSSIHFTLLGFVLAYFDSAPAWDKYDQGSAFGIESLCFPQHGTLAEQVVPYNVTHGYIEASWTDVWGLSALGGWTCGNMLTNAPTQSTFIYNLFSNRSTSPVISPDLVEAMLNFRYLSASMSWAGAYGLGVQLLPQGTDASGRYYGHGGETYGFETSVGYNDKLDFALSLGTNMESAAGWHLGTLHTDIYKRIVQDICGEECKDEVNLGCTDQVGFVDEGGAACPEWVGYNCSAAIEEYDYTQLGTDMLMANCPDSCDSACLNDTSGVPYAVYEAGGGYFYHARVTYRGLRDAEVGKAGGTIENCITACDANPDCNHFVASTTGTVLCSLRSRCVFPSDYMVDPAVSVFLGVAYRTYFKPCLDGEYWHTGRASFPASSYTEVYAEHSAAKKECRELCDNSSKCRAFTVHDDHYAGEETCFLSSLTATPQTVLPHEYAPVNGSVLGLCAGASCIPPGTLSMSLEDCILQCEATSFINLMNASCKAVNYNQATKQCFLLEGIVTDDAVLYHYEEWYTWKKSYEYSVTRDTLPVMPADTFLRASTPGVLLSEGWCIDWCMAYHTTNLSAPRCLTMVYTNSSCSLYSAHAQNYTKSAQSDTWVWDGLRQSYWKDGSPVGCCTTQDGMHEGLSSNECSLLSNRRVFREGVYCNLSTIGEPDVAVTDSPLATAQPTALPATTAQPTVLPATPTAQPTEQPTVIPATTAQPTTALPAQTTAQPTSGPVTAQPTGEPTPTPQAAPTPTGVSDDTSAPSGPASDEYQIPFVVTAILLFLILMSFVYLFYLYMKRGIKLQAACLPAVREDEEKLTEMIPVSDAVDVAE